MGGGGHVKIPDSKSLKQNLQRWGPGAHIFNRHSQGSVMHITEEEPLSGAVLYYEVWDLELDLATLIR